MVKIINIQKGNKCARWILFSLFQIEIIKRIKITKQLYNFRIIINSAKITINDYYLLFITHLRLLHRCLMPPLGLLLLSGCRGMLHSHDTTLARTQLITNRTPESRVTHAYTYCDENRMIIRNSELNPMNESRTAEGIREN